MRTILVIGIGTGSPEQLTVAAIAALNRADVIFLPDKGEEKGELLALRRAIVERYVTREGMRAVPYTVPQRNAALPDYDQGVDQWHEALAGIFTDLIARLGAEETGAFLVWGDPGLYDSTLRILGKVPIPMDIRVIPGITAIQALTAAHGIALNRIGEPVLITTGRRLEPGDTDVVVMLDGKQSFLSADPDLDIFWGAYLGSPDQILISGRLGDVRDRIVATRAEARQRHGWIMDTYLLRQRDI